MLGFTRWPQGLTIKAKEFTMPTSQLLEEHPDWQPITVGIYQSVSHPELTIGFDEDSQTWDLTNEAGTFLLKGEVPELIFYGHARHAVASSLGLA